MSVFESLQTQDFEIAIRALESASRLLPIYVPDSSAGVAKMQAHSAALKEILVENGQAVEYGQPLFVIGD